MKRVSFDRAVDYYDATRALPADVGAAVTDVLAGELAGRGLCLEIGVGTGRMALPLQARGITLLGLDVSTAMMQRLVRNAGGRRPFPLLAGDATTLPLRPGSVGAVLASHLFHLVADWPAAVDQAVSTLRAGGVLLVDFGGGTPAPWDAPARELLARHGVRHIRPGVSQPGPVTRHLAGRATVRSLPAVEAPVGRTLAADLDDWQRQIHAWTWPYSPEQLAAGCRDVRAWAIGQGWALDEAVVLHRVIQWWAYGVR